MFDVYLIGAFVFAIIAGVMLVFSLLISFLIGVVEQESPTQPLRFASMTLVVGPFVALLWPLLLAAGAVCLLGYGLFTTARVVRHRSLNFS